MPDSVSPRIIKRLETTFSSGDSKYRGISSDLSSSGLFIRTRHGLLPGSIVDVEIYLPDGKICRLKGTVRRTVKTGLSSLVKDGMGIELIERDPNYNEFLKSIESPIGELQPALPKSPEAGQNHNAGKESQRGCDFTFIQCPSCGVRNRLPRDKPTEALRCGKCCGQFNRGDIR